MAENKLRAVHYSRVSTEEERQLNALSNQVRDNRDLIKAKGWVLVDEYVDEGKSGTVIKRRTEYQRLLDDMLQGRFDIIVVKDQERLQRNTRDWYLFVDNLLINNIKLFFYLENRFFNPNEDSLLTGIKAILAEDYSRNLSKKLNNSNRRRVERAKTGEQVSAMGNGKSLGYAIVNKKWVQVPEEIEVCKLIWDLYEQYDSVRKVRDEINNRGYRNSVGKPFTSESISRILKNEKAKGVIVMGRYHNDFNLKKIVEMPEERWTRVSAPELAYVSAERFERVQARFKAKTGNGRGKFIGNDPLSRKIYCAKCGAVLWKHQSNGYTNWYCSNKYAKGEIACEGNSTTTKKIEKIYAELSKDLVVNRKAVKATMLEWLNSLRESLTASKVTDNITGELKRLQRQKNRLTEAYLEEILSKEDYKAKYEELEQRIAETEKLLDPVEENEDVKEIEEVIKNIDKELDMYLKEINLERDKIDFLIEHTERITINGTHMIIEIDLLAGAIIAGEVILGFVQDASKEPPFSVCTQKYTLSGAHGKEEYTVELRLVA